MIKREKDVIKRTTESLAVQIREKWREEWDFHAPPLSEILTAASLAHQGLLGSVEGLVLEDVDLASVPPELLASLVSCGTRNVDILNVRNCDIINILDTLQTLETLSISNQSLGSEETRALVRVMETRVEGLGLGIWGDVSPDIMAITQYSGEGRCWRVVCLGNTAEKYREQMRSWAERIHWEVAEGVMEGFGVQCLVVRRHVASTL